MNPEAQRTAELIDTWATSIELHLKYATLTDEAYWQAQPWPRHQRPARWLLELAQTRVLELRRQLAARAAADDAGFAEALEIMAFLANLVGVQNIERFIPIAEPERENKEVLGQTHSKLQPLGAATTQTRTIIEPTREMHIPAGGLDRSATGSAALPDASDTAEVLAGASRAAAAEDGAPASARARAGASIAAPSPTPAMPPAAPAAAPPPAAAKPAPRREPGRGPRAAGRGQAPPPPPAPGSVEAMIIADAVRLLAWGREWHELAEAIARMADRPGVVVVRKCLRLHKAAIERGAQSGAPS